MRILAGAAFMISLAFVSVPVMQVGAAGPDEVCATASYGWNGNHKFVPWDPTVNTGVVIPGPGAGETLRILTANYSAYDQYPDGSSPTRAEAAQINEKVGLTIGGTAIGGLSADVPNGVAEGAPTDWFSGVIQGSFGGSGTVIQGGELVIRHSSLYGFNESPNSVFVSNVTVTVERCTPAPTTTAPETTAPATTAAPTTTVVSSGGPTTTVAPVAPTTTVVASGGPTTTLSGGGTLPATGGDMTLPLVLAALAAGTGTALLMVRRKANPN